MKSFSISFSNLGLILPSGDVGNDGPFKLNISKEGSLWKVAIMGPYNLQSQTKKVSC